MRKVGKRERKIKRNKVSEKRRFQASNKEKQKMEHKVPQTALF